MKKSIIKFITNVMAVACGLLFFPWILGAPGHPNVLVQWGWTIGIITIIFYLITYQIVKSSDRIVGLRKPAVRASLDHFLFLIAVLSIPAITIAVSLVVLI